MPAPSGPNVRLAIIGLGDMGCGHARGFDALEGCEIVAVVDPLRDDQRAHKVEYTRNTPRWFATTREMLATAKPDAVVIAVPDLQHRAVAEEVVAAGCDMLLEKPVATTLADADAIDRAATKAGVLCQIGLVYRYSNLYRRMAALGAEPGHQATLMWCKELRQCFPQRPWFYSQEATGGTIVEKDCHHFDIFNWVIGAEPVRVHAFGGQHVWTPGSTIECSYCPDPPRRIDAIDTVDHAVVSVEYANGARASLILCMYLRPHNLMPEGLEIGAIARSGRQVCAYNDQRLGVGGVGEPFRFENLDMLADNNGIGHIGCQEQRRDFLRCVRERRRPFADFRVGRDSLRVALAAERSIREHRIIDLKELES